jgi:competence protein ComEC
VVSIFAIFIFVLGTGATTSAVRAGIMGVLLIGAKFIGRKSDMLNSIILTATIMVVLNPYILIYDIGFQLSFAAVWGILFLAPQIKQKLSFLSNGLSENIATTLSAIIYTWPITSFYFGVFSSVAFITNLLIVPMIGWFMLLSFIMVFFSYLPELLLKAIILIDWIISSFIIQTIEFFSKLDFAVIPIKIESPILILGYYFIMIEVTYILKRQAIEKENL